MFDQIPVDTSIDVVSFTRDAHLHLNTIQASIQCYFTYLL